MEESLPPVLFPSLNGNGGASPSLPFHCTGPFILLREMENSSCAEFSPHGHLYSLGEEWKSTCLSHTLSPSRVPSPKEEHLLPALFPSQAPSVMGRASLSLSHVLFPLRALLFFWVEISPRGHLYSSKENERTSFPPTLFASRAPLFS